MTQQQPNQVMWGADMSNDWTRTARWRDLDVAQMHLWPNGPRRWTVAFFAALLLVAGVFVFLLPRYTRLTQVQQQVLQTQNQIVKTYQTSPLSLSEIPPVRQIKQNEESAWLSDLASLASHHHLNSVVLKTHELSDTERNQLRERVQNTLKDHPQWFNSQGGTVPSDWLNQVGWVHIAAQGSYSDLVAFVSALGEHDEWLAMGDIELNAVSQGQVRWQGGFWYYKEANHATR